MTLYSQKSIIILHINLIFKIGENMAGGFKALKGQGDAPTLFMAFLYFDMSFMVWTMLGPLSTEIAEALAIGGYTISAGEKATLLALPILSGAVLRILLGFGVDKLGAKTTALISQSIVIIALLSAYLLGDSITYNQLLIVALGFGFAGAVLRPVGGSIADKIGGVKSLYFFYGIVAILVFISAFVKLPFLLAIFVLFLIMANLGMANGAVFQLVPQRFGKDIGIMTGIVGAAGGIGGFLLIKTLGWSKGAFDGYATGFVIFACVVLVAIIGISFVKTRWRTTWGVQAGGMI